MLEKEKENRHSAAQILNEIKIIKSLLKDGKTTPEKKL